ncbi:MAG TPA: methyltransferase domain-containing protein [Candidatus Limnocylindrales bacterium]|nr:methyltransferase domain-containing protein [Candidatus Limnocylindrales bacterium]
MTDPQPEEAPEEQPYDRLAEGYSLHWGPVIQPAAERVLDHVAAEVARLQASTAAQDRHVDVLDVGSGTGALAIEALRRWPDLHVTGVDPSTGMLEVAARLAEERLGSVLAASYDTAQGWADELDFDDAAFDLAVSSFVLQLVPSRQAALTEIRRVLRPGGALAWVAWQRSDRPYTPDRVANEVLDRHGFDPPEPEGRNGDLASPAAAAAGMRKAGFRDVRAWSEEVAHPWTAQDYLGFFTRFDEQSLFEDLEAAERAEIEAELLEGLQQLTAEELTLRLPIVYAMGRAAG